MPSRLFLLSLHRGCLALTLAGCAFSCLGAADPSDSQSQTVSAGEEVPPGQRPVSLPDPYGLGERLVLIDYLRGIGQDVPARLPVSDLRERYWAAQSEKISYVFRDLGDASMEDMMAEVERLRGVIRARRQRIDELEMQLAAAQRESASRQRQLEQAWGITRARAMVTAQGAAAQDAVSEAQKAETPTQSITTNTAPQPRRLSVPPTYQQPALLPTVGDTATVPPSVPTPAYHQPIPERTVPSDEAQSSRSMNIWYIIGFVGLGLWLATRLRPYQQWRAQRRVRRILGQLPKDTYSVFHQVCCANDKGTEIIIDNVVVGPNAVFVIETCALNGYIKGRKADDYWQHIGKASAHTPKYSPLLIAQQKASVVQAQLHEKTRGWVPLVVCTRAQSVTVPDTLDVVLPAGLNQRICEEQREPLTADQRQYLCGSLLMMAAK